MFFRCRGMVSIWQWPLSMASGWLWQSEADQCHCNPRKIQQLRLGDPVPHALQWHWEELETLSSRWEHLGESLSERQNRIEIADPRPFLPWCSLKRRKGFGMAWLEVDFVLFVSCFCAFVLWYLLQIKIVSKEQGVGKWIQTLGCPPVCPELYPLPFS